MTLTWVLVTCDPAAFFPVIPVLCCLQPPLTCVSVPLSPAPCHSSPCCLVPVTQNPCSVICVPTALSLLPEPHLRVPTALFLSLLVPITKTLVTPNPAHQYPCPSHFEPVTHDPAAFPVTLNPSRVPSACPFALVPASKPRRSPVPGRAASEAVPRRWWVPPPPPAPPASRAEPWPPRPRPPGPAAHRGSCGRDGWGVRAGPAPVPAPPSGT